MKSLRSSKRMADSSAADEIKNLEKENERLRLLVSAIFAFNFSP